MACEFSVRRDDPLLAHWLVALFEAARRTGSQFIRRWDNDSTSFYAFDRVVEQSLVVSILSDIADPEIEEAYAALASLEAYL